MNHGHGLTDPTRDTGHRSTSYSSSDYEKSHEYEVKRENKPRATHQKKSSYLNLIWMGLLHVPIMYAIMFSMVDTRSDIFQNLNTLYMSLMMAAPMVAIMPFMMKEMYPDKKKNWFAVTGSFLVLAGAFAAIRYQAAIEDTQFIRSMIPHHSGAILMCDEAQISDPELQTLCRNISNGQRQEIVQMNQILERLNGR